MPDYSSGFFIWRFYERVPNYYSCFSFFHRIKLCNVRTVRAYSFFRVPITFTSRIREQKHANNVFLYAKFISKSLCQRYLIWGLFQTLYIIPKSPFTIFFFNFLTFSPHFWNNFKNWEKKFDCTKLLSRKATIFQKQRSSYGYSKP